MAGKTGVARRENTRERGRVCRPELALEGSMKAMAAWPMRRLGEERSVKRERKTWTEREKSGENKHSRKTGLGEGAARGEEEGEGDRGEREKERER